MSSSVSSTTPSSLLNTPSRWRRFASMLYEGVLLFGVVFLAGYLFDTLTQSRDALMHRNMRQAVLFIAMGIYFIVCWRARGQTLPMKTWDIRLVNHDGSIPSLGRLLLRYVLLWVILLLSAAVVYMASSITGYSSIILLVIFCPFTSFLWTWVDPERQFLHDRLLGTRLIDVRPTKT